MTSPSQTNTPSNQAAICGAPDAEPDWGAFVRADGTTRFRLWAPNAPGEILLEIEDCPPIVMRHVGEGYVQAEVACSPGASYRYRLTPELAVPDPASRRQAGDVHDASVVVASDDYPWRHADWQGRPWAETVLYEIHPGLAGGFAGIERRLPELAELGITAVELMPIGDFPGPRNWGYDGVLPYAPDTAYGSPHALKQLIDTAHGLGLMVFLDVVYNHFGPEGNYLPFYAPDFFRTDIHTPWGAAIDFRQPPVRRFFTENALYWLTEYRFDGLRLDAVHAISERNWLIEMAAFVHSHIPSQRHIHLVLENDDNNANLLGQGFDAQWNDDGHHVLHQLLTNETEGYYRDYADCPALHLAHCLADGFIYQGKPSVYRQGKRRGQPSGHLPSTAFVLFLQNHDQIGNRAMGERLLTIMNRDLRTLRAAVALQLLAPQIPLIFMGEERGAKAPFLYFTSHPNPQLAEAVREGRRNEFSSFRAYSSPTARERIPDPNALSTYEASNPWTGAEEDGEWNAYYRSLLALRQQVLVPRLTGARTIGAHPLGSRAVAAQWQLNDGSILSLYMNLAGFDITPDWLQDLPYRPATLLFESEPGTGAIALREGRLPLACTVATLESLHDDGRARKVATREQTDFTHVLSGG